MGTGVAEEMWARRGGSKVCYEEALVNLHDKRG